jgi:tetratricopeptide (TPR) repeat protein
MFLEKRVYQGSSGKVYPLPFTDRIAERPVERRWQAVWMENEFLRVLVLPEIGGRIHRIQDKTNDYDLIYHQHVIKPALVGLAGPWISGGIEFNWPQHHRPATFLPVDFKIEEHDDGSQTVWCSDHDPMLRMKGMHGVCLHPGKSCVELKVRAYNRTPLTQTFLWWANVATRVHEAYQSFFPPDVYYVADHARRSMSEYPLAEGFYYGVDYRKRGRAGIPPDEIPAQFVPPHSHNSKLKTKNSKLPAYAPNDLSFYANIPTPCSYMCMGSREDFFGGYDYAAQAGIVHVANHHISPGKKQWTWGNHEFGYAWDRNLTDRDAKNEFGPYIEIMAGVYTDNQPDFSFLQPGETKTWSQYWYPIQKIGPARHANADAALSLELGEKNARFGVCVTRAFPGAEIRLERPMRHGVLGWNADLVPGKPFIVDSPARGSRMGQTTLRILDGKGREIISYQPKPRAKGKVPPPATEPPLPESIAGADELFITGLHLEQYRHATRCPTLYWREALRRDPLDSRCNNAIGLWHLRRGEFRDAEKHFRNAIARLTRRNPNPYDGEPFYNLGLCLRHRGRDHEAYGAFYKAVWNQAWMAPGYHALAEIDCARKNWSIALEHLDRSLRFNTDNLRARNLKAMVLRKLKRDREADELLRETLALDPLDWWARHLAGEPWESNAQTALDVAHDFVRAGLLDDAVKILAAYVGRETRRIRRTRSDESLPTQSWGTDALVHYTLGWLLHKSGGDRRSVRAFFSRGIYFSRDYCFPARVEEIAIFETAMRECPEDPCAPYFLGNLLYDRRRHVEAIGLWEKAAALDPDYSVVWRNLGIGYFNISGKPAKARAAYDRAFRANPGDARLLYERDQLWKRLGEKPARRLRELEKHSGLVQQRDDLIVELCALLNQTGRHLEAARLLAERKFQPWEGGEGGPLGQHVRTHLALGRDALLSSRGSRRQEAQTSNQKSRQTFLTSAAAHFTSALAVPQSLGEARHLLANQSDVHYRAGVAWDLLGEKKKARQHWLAAATFKGDFQAMSVRAFSEMTYYSALSWERLGKKIRARELLRELLAYGRKLQRTPAKIDYFATSLPTMLLFEDDLQLRQETTALFLQGQAWLGLGRKREARNLLRQVLRRDPNHALAADLMAEHFRKGKS